MTDNTKRIVNKSLLDGIADAIRAKDGTSASIVASTFPDRILAIESGTDTSDATAVVSDILAGKTAYLADGEKHTGTMQTWDGTLTGNGHLNEYVLKKISYGNKAIFIANYSSTSNTYGTTVQLEAIN